MARKKQGVIRGKFTHRHTEADYMGALLDAVSLEDWRGVVATAVAAAKAGDAGARAWLAQYLIGKPGTTAPAPLTVVVQQLSGQDPLVEKLASPLIERMQYPALYVDEEIKDAVRARVAEELRLLQASKLITSESSSSTDETKS